MHRQKKFLANIRNPKQKPKTVTFAEYKLLQKLAFKFKCPLGINPLQCDEYLCPSKPDFPYDEYLWECREHKQYRIKLLKAQKGKIQVE